MSSEAPTAAELPARGPAEAFQRGREFAHLHLVRDGSLHLTLPAGVYDQVQAAGCTRSSSRSHHALPRACRTDLEHLP